MFEGLGVGQGVGVFHRLPMHHVANRQLDDLAADGARDIADRSDHRRYMARGGITADHLANPCL
ncbi:hypothetical protein D3C72_2083080 [compost metagenome]